MRFDDGIFDLYSRLYDNRREIDLSPEDDLGKCSDDPSFYAGAAERMLKAIGEPTMIDPSQDGRLGRIFKVYPGFSDFLGMEETIERSATPPKGFSLYEAGTAALLSWIVGEPLLTAATFALVLVAYLADRRKRWFRFKEVIFLYRSNGVFERIKKLHADMKVQQTTNLPKDHRFLEEAAKVQRDLEGLNMISASAKWRRRALYDDELQAVHGFERLARIIRRDLKSQQRRFSQISLRQWLKDLFIPKDVSF